jgi:LysM repeat protein
MLQTHQYIWKCLQQVRRGRRVERLSIGIILGLLFCGIALSINVPGAQAYTPATCSATDQTYVVVAGDTLSGIAQRYHTSWPALASYNHVSNPNLIYIDQTICIPQGGLASNSVDVQLANVQETSTSASTTLSPMQYQPGTIPDMINQVFGPYGSAAINVATCESSLNPNAYNPVSVAGSHAEGLFQILYPSTWAGTSQAANSPFNPMANILAAHEIFARDGYSWREWSCQP